MSNLTTAAASSPEGGSGGILSQPPEELSGPLTLLIGLNWFFDKHTRGIHGYATVSRTYGDYIKSLDPLENSLHVDYPDYSPTLAHIYPILTWKEAVRKWTLDKQHSEEERQRRFIKEAELNNLKLKYKQREAEVDRVLTLFKNRFAAFVNKQSGKMVRAIVIQSLQGKTDPAIRTKLSIDQTIIDEFLALPQPSEEEEDSILSLLNSPENPSASSTEGVRVST